MENTNPKVYVGTWRKYNNGSIQGAWIDLSQFATYAEFVAKCKAIHKDENDPEFMIQDFSNFPDGLSAGDWMSENEFNDIMAAYRDELSERTAAAFQLVDYSEKAVAVIGDTKAIKDELKKLGGRFNPRLSCGAGWIFPKSKLEQLQALVNSGEMMTNEPAKKDEPPYKANLLECLEGCDNFYKGYYKDYKIGAVKINGGFVLIDKPRIENQFCWADEGPQYEHYKEVHSSDENLKRYFLAQNLKDFDHQIDMLLDCHDIYLTQPDKNGRVEYYKIDHYWGNGEKRNETDKKITLEQSQEIIEALRWGKAQFEKRLQTYLKRYGTSKLHTWTYWADR